MGQKEMGSNIISVPTLDMPKIRGMGTTFFHKMLEIKDKIAQIDGISGEKDSYGYLLQKCVRTAIRMRSEGLKSGDIISICSFNHLNSCVPFLAGLFLDVKTASLDPTISLPDTIHLLKQVSPKMIFVGPEAIELIEEALIGAKIECKIVVFGETEDRLRFSDFLRPSPEEKNFVPVEVQDVKATVVILFSSGTTGLPKGICLSHYSLLAVFYQNNVFCGPNETVLAFTSMYWISAIMTIMHTTMNAGTRLIYPKFDPSVVWKLVDKHKVNVMFLAPNQLLSASKNRQPKQEEISSLKYIFTGGAPLFAEQILEIRKLLGGMIISKAWGQTELSGGGTIFRFASDPKHRTFLLEKPESSGTVMSGFSYKIADVDTEEALGPYQEGEIRVKSEMLMNGYYNIDSSDCWDSEGFLKTGDVGYYDEDHCFYIVDRIKEMLKFQSWHVPPAKIENVLLTHPAVENAVVLGLPHPEDGDHPLGVVILKETNAGDVTAEELEKYVEDRVDDRQKLRGGVKFVKKFLETPTGKTNRRRMRDFVSRGETW